jgi:peroxiredoxin
MGAGRIRSLFLAAALLPSVARAQEGGSTPSLPKPRDRSHSAHGPAFNEGPRQVAWKMAGVGTAHFPVTTAKPEAQVFFDQGINLLHSFWFYEAERSFRHVVWLDPDCAMAYWGLAMAVRGDGSRAREFIQKAKGKAAKATDRERRYIDALFDSLKEGGDDKSKQREYVRALEKIILADPDDIEAKAFLALTSTWGGDGAPSRVATEALIKEILAVAPEHPGAHHYRIHLWDGPDGEQAAASLKAYPRAAPFIGHAQHMPGHIYAQLGRWEEAARAMEAAARVERRYFRDHGMLPFHSWNYAHDLHYLISILGYLGRVEEGTRLARELLAVPRDPKHNGKGGGSAQGQGRFALMRMLVRFEKWDAVLAGDPFEWTDTLADRGWRAYTLGLAHLGKGNKEEAKRQLEALEGVRAEAEKAKNDGDQSLFEAAGHELGGLLLLAEGNVFEAFERLQKAADLERKKLTGNDPGPYPRPIIETLGRAHLQARNWGLAEATFKEALRRTPNSGPALAGLMEACKASGKNDAAADAYSRLRKVWRYADADLPQVRRAQSVAMQGGFHLRLVAREPAGVSPSLGGAPWETGALDALGPNTWEPAPAPDFALRDEGRTVRLSNYRGRNLLLVFYLGNDCSHCLEQLNGLAKEMPALKERDTAVVAVSASPISDRRPPILPFPTAFDPDHTIAKRYQAHDTFESRDLHAVVFIDRDQRVRWYTVGSTPFTDWGFLKGEIDRVTRLRAASGRS